MGCFLIGKDSCSRCTSSISFPMWRLFTIDFEASFEGTGFSTGFLLELRVVLFLITD